MQVLRFYFYSKRRKYLLFIFLWLHVSLCRSTFGQHLVTRAGCYPGQHQVVVVVVVIAQLHHHRSMVGWWLVVVRLVRQCWYSRD